MYLRLDVHRALIAFLVCLLQMLSTSGFSADPPSTFRLADGTELPVEQWPKSYETLEYQPPINSHNAKHVVQLQPGDRREIWSIALDANNRKLYWMDANGYEVAKNGRICCKDLASGDEKILASGIDGLRSLCLAPSQDKMFWLAQERPGSEANSIFQSNLDGSGAKSIITGIQFCRTLQFDPSSHRLYWHNRDTISSCQIGGNDVQSASVRCGDNGFAIDFARKLVYFQDAKSNRLMQCRFDKSAPEAILGPVGLAQSFYLDSTGEFLYWSDTAGIARAHLPNPIGPEKLTETDRSTGYRPWFAIDTHKQTVYWTSYWSRRIPNSVDGEEEGAPMLISEVLPAAWRKVTLPAPPLILSIKPSSAKEGEDIAIEGNGFQTVHSAAWIESPGGSGYEVNFRTAKTMKADFKVVSDNLLSVKAPTLIEQSKFATLVVVADGGVTVTLPRNLKRIVDRPKPPPKNFETYLVQRGGYLDAAGNCVALLQSEAICHGTPADYCNFFVKNGALLAGPGFRSKVFHEPFARLTFRSNDPETFVPVGAIRASFVDELFKPIAAK